MKPNETSPHMSAPAQKDRPASPGRRRFLRWTLGSTLLCGSTAAYGRWIETERLTVTNLDVRVEGWPRASAGLRVGQLSDMHCDCDRAVERTARAARLLMEQKPDVVFLTGDYITVDPHRWSAPCADALAPLAAAPGGVFAILGNHDHWAADPDEVARQLHRVGFTVLRNRSAPLKNAPGIWVVGLEDRCEKKQDPARALRNVPGRALKLLLIHEPDYADEAPPEFALQFSGHSHGGQIRVPGLPALRTPLYARRYVEGLEQAKHHRVYTTRGVGVIGPRFRLFCPPEATLLRLGPA